MTICFATHSLSAWFLRNKPLNGQLVLISLEKLIYLSLPNIDTTNRLIYLFHGLAFLIVFTQLIGRQHSTFIWSLSLFEFAFIFHALYICTVESKYHSLNLFSVSDGLIPILDVIDSQ